MNTSIAGRNKYGSIRIAGSTNTVINICILISFFIFQRCNTEKVGQPLFQILEQGSTGLNFTNKLLPTDSFNVFHYMYYYNGAGVGAGDFNNDGLTDLFFAANQGDDKIFLNEGKLHFKDVTVQAKIP
ncbi:MAG TPA: VCBS repeat-containing protein, partial [Panacibacter sp.]|nr:VCBS repeat-containing protein [Panacibacter sp.]